MTMNKRTIPSPKGQMKTVVNDLSRFKVVVASRRLGKSFNGLIWLTLGALSKGNTLAKYWYVAPTYREAKDIAWDILKHITKYIRIKANESTLEVTLINNTKISLKGADNPDSLRGRAIDRVLFDEYATMKSDVWEIVRPSLSDTKGEALFIGTPKGNNHFKELYYNALEGNLGDEYKAFPVFMAKDSPFIDDNEIELARRELTPQMFRQEYEASFEDFEGQIFRYEDIENAIEKGKSYLFSGSKVRTWDLATTKSTHADYTAGGLFGRFGDDMIMLDMVRGKWEYPQVREIILETARKDGYHVPIVIEGVGGFKSVYQDLDNILRPNGYRIILENRASTGDKLVFSAPIQAKVNSGHFIIMPFNNIGDVVKEWTGLSYDLKSWKHDDTLDTASMAYKLLFGSISQNKPITGGQRKWQI